MIINDPEVAKRRTCSAALLLHILKYWPGAIDRGDHPKDHFYVHFWQDLSGDNIIRGGLNS